MDQSLKHLEQLFELPDCQPGQYSPLTLAYIGDAIYELVIRTILVREANTQVNKLHKRASSLVKAETQSFMIEVLEQQFTEEELQIYKRGRNAKSFTSAKNASITDYRRATGFEAVMGYLYLKGEYDRIIELVYTGIKAKESGK
ncbi:MAG: ribonuclease III domain-containing protein [Lachnospiraceae bacterium]|nr:ribonuclease III domain-containing protein [Lachnospiraceae bacterium]